MGYPVVELLEMDDGAVLALLERLVRPGAVVVRDVHRLDLVLRVRLLAPIPAAGDAYAEQKP
jgi:hypothetical protein